MSARARPGLEWRARLASSLGGSTPSRLSPPRSRSLRFDDKPDYAYLRKIMRELFAREGFAWDYLFDWTILKASVAERLRHVAGGGWPRAAAVASSGSLPVPCPQYQKRQASQGPSRGTPMGEGGQDEQQPADGLL